MVTFNNKSKINYFLPGLKKLTGGQGQNSKAIAEKFNDIFYMNRMDPLGAHFHCK